MKETASHPIYSQIAMDIALRIARGELKENTKIYGRSIMSSEYGVSPETIRRALKLLEDMDIVEIRQNSGTVIISAEKAKEYIARFNANEDVRSQYHKLKALLSEQERLNRQILTLTRDIIRTNERFSKTHPFQNFEMVVPSDSPILGRSLGELQFWQKTGATIIAIRREEKIILSPGPYVVVSPLDILIFVGNVLAIDTVDKFVHGEYV